MLRPKEAQKIAKKVLKNLDLKKDKMSKDQKQEDKAKFSPRTAGYVR